MKNHRKPLSRFFPAHHPKAGQPTYFLEKLRQSLMDNGISYSFDWNVANADKDPMLIKNFVDSITGEMKWHGKHHTIRQCNISKKTGLPLKVEVGDTITFYVWSGKPYNSPQIVVSPPIEIKKVWGFEIKHKEFFINGEIMDRLLGIDLAINDGLIYKDLLAWFKYPKPTGPCQIICWSDSVNY